MNHESYFGHPPIRPTQAINTPIRSNFMTPGQLPIPPPPPPLNHNFFRPSTPCPPPPVPAPQAFGQLPFNPPNLTVNQAFDFNPQMTYNYRHPPPMMLPNPQTTNYHNSNAHFYQPQPIGTFSNANNFMPQQYNVPFYPPNTLYDFSKSMPSNPQPPSSHPTPQSLAQQQIKPAPPPSPDLFKPPPPPDEKIPIPPTCSPATVGSMNKNETNIAKPSTTNDAVVFENNSFLDSFQNKVLSRLTKSNTNDSISSHTSGGQESETAEQYENPSNRSQNSIYNPARIDSATSTTDKFSTDSVNSSSNPLFYRRPKKNQNLVSNLSSETNQNNAYRSYDKSHYDSMNLPTEPLSDGGLKKQKKNEINDLDTKTIKNELGQIQSQLDHIDQMKNEQKLIEEQKNQHNLMNKSQTLFTQADDHWLQILNPDQKSVIERLKAQQKNFEDIYKNWENDYESWKEKNITVLDNETYQTNLKEWEDWKTNLLDRKIKLNKTCQEKIDDLKKQVLGDNYRSPISVQQSSHQDSSVNIDKPVNVPFDDLNDHNDQLDLDKQPSVVNVQKSNSDQETSSQYSSRYDNQTALFPSSKTIIEKKIEEEKKQSKIANACNLLDFIKKTRNTLNIIDKLDFRAQQDRIKYDQQLEIIRKTIEHQHSDSEEEELDESCALEKPVKIFSNKATSPRSNLLASSSLNESLRTDQQFDLNSVLNKMNEIKNSAPITESRNCGTMKEYTDYSMATSNTMSTNNLPVQPLFTRDRQRIRRELQAANQTSDPIASTSQEQSKFDNDFLSKLGIDLSSANQVLSYENMDYFLKPPFFTLNAEDLFELPARDYRPKNLCLILRGHPGSGKSRLIKMLCQEEINHRNRLPRIFDFGDYLQNEKNLENNELYINNADLVERCKKHLFDDFSDAVKNGQHNFLIFNAINHKHKDFEHFYIIAKLYNYSTYIAEMAFREYSEIPTQTTMNDLNYDEWAVLEKNWEPTPASYIKLQINKFIQNRTTHDEYALMFEGNHLAILDRKRAGLSEDLFPSSTLSSQTSDHQLMVEDVDFVLNQATFFRKLDLGDHLAYDKLDDYRMKMRRPIDEYWSLPHDYYQRKFSRVKRVCWLDIKLKEK